MFAKENIKTLMYGGIALVATLCLYAGCERIVVVESEPVSPVEYYPPVPPRPTLVAAGDPQMTLFGEIPGVPTYEFESRSAISLRQHSYPSEGNDFDPSMSRDGKRMIFASTRHSMSPDIYYKDVDGVAVVQLTSDPASDVQPCFSPDGRRVAFASDRAGNWDIWVVNLDGQQAVQVTSSAGHEAHPTWSPDGTQLVFCSMAERGGQWELWLVSAEAGAVKKFIGYGLFPEWAPNSNTILYQRARRRGTRWFSLWTLKLVNGEPRMPTEILSSPQHAMILPTWSPDETQISYCAVENVAQISEGEQNPLQRGDIWMVDIDGRAKVRLTDQVGANYAPTWSKLGRIYFTSGRRSYGDNESIWSVIPLRAPMAAQERPRNDSFSRSDEVRANEVIWGQDDSRVETVGHPADRDEE